MNRLINRDISLLCNDDDEDEERLFEKKALIDDDQINNDDSDLMFQSPRAGARMRYRSKLISNHNDQEFELRTRDVSEPVIEYTYYDVQPGDSLQSVCLRYACSVTQVKRINGLITDQEFYGLRRIKLPLGKLGLLEDVLRSDEKGSESIVINEADGSMKSIRNVNCPGSAMFISPRAELNKLTSSMTGSSSSSDKINELSSRQLKKANLTSPTSSNHHEIVHSHSFTSISDLANNNNIQSYDHINLDKQPRENIPQSIRAGKLINSDVYTSDRTVTQDLMTDVAPVSIDHVGKVFENLDYHVERAKVAAKDYDERAEELVNRIDTNGASHTIRIHPARVSKIPELFFCNENFGLSYRKLIVFILVVCLIVPLIYVSNQSNFVTTQLK